MPQRDGTSDKELVHGGVMSASGTSTVTGDWIDVRDCNSVMFIVALGTVTDAGAAAGFTVSMQEDDVAQSGGATDVASDGAVSAVSLQNTADDADNSILGALGYIGNKRYVRLKVVGTTGTDAEIIPIAVKERNSYQAGPVVGAAI